jgi:glucokinase
MLGPALLLLGIDIGGTKIEFSLGDESGKIHRRLRRATQPSGRAEADLRRIAEDAQHLIAAAGARPDEIAAVGASVPGPLDLEAGLVLNPPNLPSWDRAPVRDVLAEKLGCPVFLENDANAAALAEWRFGAGRGYDHLVYLTMSTGVGGGLILGGRVHRGVSAGAGEVGHMLVEWNGERCGCGLRGCLEAYIGGACWTRRLREVTPPESRVATLAGGRDQVRPEQVVEAARQGDAFALAEMERFNKYLVHALVNLTFLLAPQVFVLGTIAVAAGEELCFGPVRRGVAAHTWPVLSRELKIVPAALGDRLADYAGLSVAIDGLACLSHRVA